MAGAFKDSSGREWHIRLTIGSFIRVRDLCGIDLQKPHEGEPRPLAVRLALAEDLESLEQIVNVLWAIIEPQAKAAGVNDEEFGESLGGDVLGNVLALFLEEWGGFFVGLKKQVLADVVFGAARLVKQAMDAAHKKVAQFDIEAAVKKAFETEAQKDPRAVQATAACADYRDEVTRRFEAPAEDDAADSAA